jgi:acyl-CoA synthetase (AMP-forming)/AMP-acid ligase II
MEELQADCLCATPSYARALLRHGTPAQWSKLALRQVTLGGEAADQRLLDGLRAAAKAARLTHVYASTEAGAVLAVKDGREGFDAALCDGERLKLVEGELWVRRGARSMLGYSGEEPPGPDDGWIKTGDLVTVEGGRALFRGRLSDLINVGGHKVNPVEVEAVMAGVEGVREARLVGHPSSLVGNLPKAIVAVEPAADRAAVQAEIVRRCSAQLARHMVPRLFEFTDRLERSVAQKAVRR